MAVDLTSGPEVGLLNLHFFYICRHHPTLKFKPHATDDERYILGIDGVPLRSTSAIALLISISGALFIALLNNRNTS